MQISMPLNFVSSKDSNEVQTMYTKSDNADVLIGNTTDDIIKELFESTLKRYQSGLEESMRGSEFVYDCVNELFYRLHKFDLNRRKSYINSPTWLKNKKSAINPKNMKHDLCFQYAITIA